MNAEARINKKQARQEEQYSFPYHHVARFRDGFSSTYYVKYGLKQVSSLEFILDQLKQLNFHTLCDVGCGDGRLAMEAYREFPKAQVSGIDYSQRAINLAKGFCPDVNFICQNIVEEDHPDKYDVATLIEVFEHIPVALCESFVQALTGLIQEGGHLLVTVPHKNLPLSAKHEQHFDLAGLKAHFGKDFEVIEERFLEKRGGWRIYLYYRLLKNKLFLLNFKPLLNWIYNGYKKHLLLVENERDCERLYLLLRRNNANTHPICT